MPHKQPIGNTQQHSERQLLLRVADGDRAAFATLYQQHLPILYQYVYRFSKQSKTTTDEIVQEVFITIWEKKETLIGIQSFSAYAYKIAKNKLLNSLKKEVSTQKMHEQLASLQPQYDASTEKGLVYADYHSSALRAIAQLPEKRKQIFLLSTQYELSLDEIAAQMQVSKSRVKQQLLKAKNFIKSYMAHHAEWLTIVVFLWHK